jgi:hypothetical protein
MALILICGRSGRMTFNNQMSGYDGHRTIRDLEQYIDEVVAYTPNKQITRIRQWTKIVSKVRQSRPKDR